MASRDTLVLPTDINYHRDHLGIVQNNFPDIIRLGDGDEVRDVPHPLSRPGLSAYDFAITDSLRFEIPGRVIDVYEVKVRPRDDNAAAAIGALYISKEDAQVVRMAFSTKDMKGEMAGTTGGEEMDEETKAMMTAFFEGHSITIRAKGKQITESNMTVSADKTSAEVVIPFLDLINGTTTLPDELFAVIQTQ